MNAPPPPPPPQEPRPKKAIPNTLVAFFIFGLPGIAIYKTFKYFRNKKRAKRARKEAEAAETARTLYTAKYSETDAPSYSAVNNVGPIPEKRPIAPEPLYKEVA